MFIKPTVSTAGNQPNPVLPAKSPVTAFRNNWSGIFPHRSETAPTQREGPHAWNVPQRSHCLSITQTIAAKIGLAVRIQTIVSLLRLCFENTNLNCGPTAQMSTDAEWMVDFQGLILFSNLASTLQQLQSSRNINHISNFCFRNVSKIRF